MRHPCTVWHGGERARNKFPVFESICSFHGGNNMADERRSLGEPAPNLGACEACQCTFPYRLIHNGFNDSSYSYCDVCGTTAILNCYDARFLDPPMVAFGRIGKDAEPLLRPCTCGGRFTSDAVPRCPICNTPISATAASSWIEANAAGTAEGWQWQLTWDGLYCIIIAGRVDYDPFVTPNSFK